MPLTDTAVRNAKPDKKPYKLTDGGGLYLLVNNDRQILALDYRFVGKRKDACTRCLPGRYLAKATGTQGRGP